jgi:hypothetical protein
MSDGVAMVVRQQSTAQMCHAQIYHRLTEVALFWPLIVDLRFGNHIFKGLYICSADKLNTFKQDPGIF